MHDIVEAIRILVHTGPIGDMLALEVTTNIQQVGWAAWKLENVLVKVYSQTAHNPPFQGPISRTHNK